MINLIKGEFYKLKKSNGLKLTTIVTLISVICVCIYFQITFERHPETMATFTGINVIRQCFGQVLGGNFLFSLLATVFVAKDFYDSSINKSFSYGYSRWKIILSKLVVYIITTFILSIIYTIFITVWFLIYSNTSICLNFQTVICIFKIMIISGICMVATISITFMIATISQNIVITLISPLMLLVITWIITNITITDYSLSKFLPFTNIWLAIGERSNLREVTFVILSAIITFILSIGVTLMHINKKEFK